MRYLFQVAQENLFMRTTDLTLRRGETKQTNTQTKNTPEEERGNPELKIVEVN